MVTFYDVGPAQTYSTIAAALAAVFADEGATAFTDERNVRVFADTYNESVDPNDTLSPTAANKLIIEAQSSAVELDGTGLGNVYAFDMRALSNFEVKGFLDIHDYTYSGIGLCGVSGAVSNVLFEDMYCYDCTAAAVGQGDGYIHTGATVDDVTFRRCTSVRTASVASGFVIRGTTNPATNVVFDTCHAIQSGGDGIDLVNTARAHTITIQDCLILSPGGDGIDLTSTAAGATATITGTRIFLPGGAGSGGAGITATNNMASLVVEDCVISTARLGEGINIALAAGETIGSVEVRRCRIEGETASIALGSGGTITDVTVENCLLHGAIMGIRADGVTITNPATVFYCTIFGRAIQETGGSVGPWTIRDCLVRGWFNTASIGAAWHFAGNSTLAMSHNYYAPAPINFAHHNGTDYATFADWAAAVGETDEVLVQGPGVAWDGADGFVDESAWDFHPAEGHGAFNAGTPIAGITTDLDGVTRDVTTPTIGCYETTAIVASGGGALVNAGLVP